MVLHIRLCHNIKIWKWYINEIINDIKINENEMKWYQKTEYNEIYVFLCSFKLQSTTVTGTAYAKPSQFNNTCKTCIFRILI